MINRKCRFCDSTQNVTRVKKRFNACASCKPAVYAVLNLPDVIEEVWPLLQDRAILPQSRRIKIPWKTDTAEMLDAKRYKAKDREDNNWYLIVSEWEGKPVELFMSSADDNNHKLQFQIANLTALTRLVSLMLRHVFLGERITLEKIKTQLKRSSRVRQDLPDLVLNVLSKDEIQ